MPEISRDEVAHLADLARIDLYDAELDHLAAAAERDPRVGRLDPAASPPTTSRRPRTRSR